jgi:hypothetical protein
VATSTRLASGGALVGLVAGAIALAALAPKPGAPPVAETAGEPTASPPAHPAVAVARRFAMAAHEWEGSGYAAAYRRRLALATRSYRRELARARPSEAELRAREADRAASTAEVIGIELAERGIGHARVSVALRERLVAGGESIEQRTLHTARLVREAGSWRVERWALVPAGEGER